MMQPQCPRLNRPLVASYGFRSIRPHRPEPRGTSVERDAAISRSQMRFSSEKLLEVPSFRRTIRRTVLLILQPTVGHTRTS